MKSFLAMLCFFTRIPVRVNCEIDDALFKRGIKHLFLIALIIGIPIGLVFMIEQWTGRYIAAFVSLAFYLFLSGGLHVDGMADTADAFGSNRGKQRMLDIMKDSHIGTFGVLAICVYIAGMIISMAQADFIIIGLFPLVGRTAALICAGLFKYARKDGAAKSFIDGTKTIHVIAAVLAFIIITLLFSLDFSAMTFNAGYAITLFSSYIMSLAVIVLVVFGMSRKLGGITGDIIGFGIETASLLFVFAACVLLRLW